MNWIKVLNRHILAEYSDLKDTEFTAWIKVMALTAELEHIPSQEQMLKFVHYKTLESLRNKLNKHSIDLQYILNKVLIDVQCVSNRRMAWKTNKQEYRRTKESVSPDVSPDVLDKDKIREDKINKDIRTSVDMPPWLKGKTWDEFLIVRKKLKAPNTDHAIGLLIAKLSRMKNEGGNPEEIINQSIENGWKGVFPVKENNGGHRISGRGPGVPTTDTEWKPEAPLSDEQIRKNQERVRSLIEGKN